jgi:hypothetical protein
MPFSLNVNINLGRGDATPLSPAGSHSSSIGSPPWDAYSPDALYLAQHADAGYAYADASAAYGAAYGGPADYFSHPSTPTSGTSPSSSASSPLPSPPPSRAPSSGPARAAKRTAKPGSPTSGKPKKMHQCGLCAKTMSRNYDLHRHLQSVHGLPAPVTPGEDVNTPAGPRAWACGACGKAFSRKDSMQRHQRDEGCRALPAPRTTDA